MESVCHKTKINIRTLTEQKKRRPINIKIMRLARPLDAEDTIGQ